MRCWNFILENKVRAYRIRLEYFDRVITFIVKQPFLFPIPVDRIR